MTAATRAASSAPAAQCRAHMFVATLDLRDFRSYPHQALELAPGLNMLVGPNGVGKTNLLEAVHVGLQGFALRTRRDATVVRFGADATRVSTRGERANGVPFSTAVTIDTRGTKRIELDGAQASSLDALRRAFPVLVFTPDRLAIVKGGPIVRRMIMDRAVGRLLPARGDIPAAYATALSQRNAALRRVQAQLSSSAALAPWNDALIRFGDELDAARSEVTDRLAPRFARHAEALGLPGARMVYRRSGVDAPSLERCLARDVERGTTGIGPHLAELELAAGERDLRLFGSQGEQRIAVLAMLLAEADALLELAEQPPILLLDDLLSELDDQRRTALVAAIPPGCQAIVTATSTRALPSSGPEPALVVDVSPGKATPR